MKKSKAFDYILKCAFFLLLQTMAFKIYACSCAGTLKDQVTAAEKIVLAKATSAKLKSEANLNFEYVEVDFSVLKMLKGTSPKKVVVKTGPGNGGCGVPIEVRKIYVLFLRKDTNVIGMCDGSHQLFEFQRKTLPREIELLVKDASKT